MVSYVDICLFSQNLATTTPCLSRDERRDMATLIEEEHLALGGRYTLKSFVPIFNGQYHIDFWLSQVEFLFVNSFVSEENKCDYVASDYFSNDVRQAYDSMQWSRIHRGEAFINDWPTLKTLLRCVFLPLTEQLHTTVSLNHLPSPPPPKKKKIISTTTQQPAAADLLRKIDSLSLSSCLCSCSNNKNIHDKHERDVQSLKEKIADSQLKLAEIQDVLVQCSTMLIPASSNEDVINKRERYLQSSKNKRKDASLFLELARQGLLDDLYMQDKSFLDDLHIQ